MQLFLCVCVCVRAVEVQRLMSELMQQTHLQLHESDTHYCTAEHEHRVGFMREM